jgi:hypothetical protein
MAEENKVSEEELDQAPDDKMLGMSDDDIMNMSPEEFAEKAGTEPRVEEPEPEPEEEEEAPSEEEDEEPEEVLEEEPGPREDVYDSAEPVEEEEIEEEESSEINYKAEYENLLSPFKASGREVKVNSVEDARTLMQKGVDYNNKMRALKPHLRIMRALEQNDLLSEEKINHFIDLDKKNPEAIARFLKDKGIDPLEVDLDEAPEQYQPQSYAPTDQQMAVDEVLESIRDTESYDRTIDELANKWDSESKQVFMQNPQLIRTINEHVAAGVYDQIMNAVESERLLGRLQGLHDLAAYKTVGDAIQANGGFDHLTKKSAPSSNNRKPAQDPKIKARKRAAAPTKRTPKRPQTDFNPLAMSDEEFEKVAAPL